MLFPRTMYNSHIVLAQNFEPSRYLALWIFEIKKPCETAMIRPDNKLSTQQVMVELLGESYDS